MNAKKVARTKSRLSSHHTQLEADIAQIERFRAAGLSPLEALAAFQTGLSVDDRRDALARDAMRELLRGSAVGQVIEDASMVTAIAATSYRLADAMRTARGAR